MVMKLIEWERAKDIEGELGSVWDSKGRRRERKSDGEVRQCERYKEIRAVNMREWDEPF